MDVRRYIALALVLVAVVTIFAPSRRAVVRVVRPRPAPAVIVPPALTPLQAKHARRSAAGRSPDSARRTLGSPGAKTTIGPHPLARPQNRPLPSREPKTVKTKRDRRKPSQRPAQGHQPSNPPAPPAKQCPPVNVTVPAPITVGVGPLGVNCP